jgi:hypothetical protein
MSSMAYVSRVIASVTSDASITSPCFRAVDDMHAASRTLGGKEICVYSVPAVWLLVIYNGTGNQSRRA